MTGGPAIAVVVPHLEQPEALERCLAAIRADAVQPAEIVVVDNGSAALPEAVCARHGATLLSEPLPGPGPARNRGVAAASAEVIAFVDADCLPRPGWLAAVRATFADGYGGVVGGDVRVVPDAPRRPTLVEAYEAVHAFRMDRYIAREGFTGAGNMAARRDTIVEVGPFAGIGVAEDRDWGRRATAMGVPLRFVPAMRVDHPARPSMADLARKWDRQIAHDRAEGAGALRWWLKAAALPLSPLASLPEIATTDRLAGPRARAACAAGLVLIRLHRARRMAELGLGADPARLAATWRAA